MNPPALSRRRMIASCVAVSAVRHVWARELSAHVTAVCFAPDAKRIVVGSQAGVSIHDASDYSMTARISTELDHVHDVRFSPDGQLLAIAGGVPGELGAVELVEWPSGDLRRRIESHDDVVYRVAFSGDGSRMVSASADEVCSVHQDGRHRAAARFTQHSRAVTGVTVLPDGETAVSASRDQTLRVWNTNTGENLRTLHNHSRDVNALALQPATSGLPVVASASADATVRFWQPTIGRMVRFARLPSEPLSIAWVAGSAKLIAGCRDGKARLIDPVTVNTTETSDVSDGWLYAIAVDPLDDHRVVIGSTRGLIKVLRI